MKTIDLIIIIAINFILWPTTIYLFKSFFLPPKKLTCKEIEKLLSERKKYHLK